MNYLKNVLCILLIALILLTMTGCWDNTEIDDKAYVISLGLDTGSQSKLQVSLLIAIPKNISEGGEGKSSSSSAKGQGGSQGKESSEVVTVEAQTIPAALNMVNVFISREISLAHLKALVFSEEIARKGIGDYLDYFDRDREVRSVANVIVSTTSADAFIRSLKPVLETSPSKYIELTSLASKHTALIPKTTLGDFVSATISYDEQPIAVLGGINKKAINEEAPISAQEPFRIQPDAADPNEGEYLPGNIPRKGDVERELMGTALFDGGKMVGVFNGLETSVMLMLRGEFLQDLRSIQDPKKKDSFVPIDIRQKKPPTIKINREGNKFDIHVTLNLEGNILAIQSGIQYEDKQYMVVLEKSIAEYISKNAERIIKIAQTEYKADVFKFGNYARRTFWTEDDFEKVNWKGAFCKAKIKVDTRFSVNHSGLSYKSEPIISSEGAEY